MSVLAGYGARGGAVTTIVHYEGGLPPDRPRSVHQDDERVRAEPFDAIELDLAVLWSDLATR